MFLISGLLLQRCRLTSRAWCFQIVEPRRGDESKADMLPTLENVTNFTTALRALSFPASAIFSLPDLESTGWEERYVAPAPSSLWWELNDH